MATVAFLDSRVRGNDRGDLFLKGSYREEPGRTQTATPASSLNNCDSEAGACFQTEISETLAENDFHLRQASAWKLTKQAVSLPESDKTRSSESAGTQRAGRGPVLFFRHRKSLQVQKSGTGL